jgi:DNA polymerase III epsilon subunit family exonuclease
MDDLIPEFDFCVVDLETTGYSPADGAGIIEVGSVLINDGQIDRTFHEMVDPGHEIPPEITRLTGIQNEDIAGADPVDRVLERFLDFRDEAIFIAHNASFDLGFIKHYGPEKLDDTHVDTVTLARRLFDFESNALTELIREFNLDREDAHRALDDALATAELFLILSREISEPEDYLRCGIPRKIRKHTPYDLDRQLDEHNDVNSPREARPFIRDLLIETDRSVGINKWAKILAGSKSDDVKKYRDNPGYGRLGDWTQRKIKKLLNEMIADGELRRTEGNYPVLEPILNSTENSEPLSTDSGSEPF